MKWPIIRLEQLAARESSSIKIGPFGSQLKKTELVASGIHVVGIENVISNIFDGLGDRYITEEKFSTLRSFEVKPGDVLMTMMGAIREVGIVPQGTSTSIMDSHLLRFRPNPKLCTPEYLAWLLKGSASTRSALQEHAHGAIMKGLNSGIVRSFPAYFIPYQSSSGSWRFSTRQMPSERCVPWPTPKRYESCVPYLSKFLETRMTGPLMVTLRAPNKTIEGIANRSVHIPA